MYMTTMRNSEVRCGKINVVGIVLVAIRVNTNIPQDCTIINLQFMLVSAWEIQ
jgi:hypothetical protein